MTKPLPDELVTVEYEWLCPECGTIIDLDGTLEDKARFIDKTHAHMEQHK